MVRVSSCVVRRFIRPLAPMLLFATLGAPSASASDAATRIAPKRGDIAGPVLAGDAVVWGRSVRDGYEVVTQRGSDAKVTHITVTGLKGTYRRYVYPTIEASVQRLIVRLAIFTCS